MEKSWLCEFVRITSEMWSHQAKAMTWVYLKIWLFFHLFTVYILNNVFCKFQVIHSG